MSVSPSVVSGPFAGDIPPPAATEPPVPLVLVIEDDELVADVVERLLVRLGKRVLRARDGAEGAQMFAELKKLAARHAVIGDVRGGKGLFAVIELVADRATKAPVAPWPGQSDAMKAMLAAARDEGVSFGSRGNLLILAPPLVIAEEELVTALGVLDRLLTRFFPASLERAS